jgi:hypothetical protein
VALCEELIAEYKQSEEEKISLMQCEGLKEFKELDNIIEQYKDKLKELSGE